MPSDTAETLAAWAEFYGEFPECLPDGWSFRDEKGVGEVVIGEGRGPAMALVPSSDFYRDALHVDPWFLALALGTLREMLEAKGWDQHKDSRCSKYWWISLHARHITKIVTCPHLAAQAAWRAISKEVT